MNTSLAICPNCKMLLSPSERTSGACKSCGTTSGIKNRVTKGTDNYQCPHCGDDVLTEEEVMHLGPAFSIKCPSCRQKCSVPWSSAICFLTIFLGPAVATFLLIVMVGEFDTWGVSFNRSTVSALKYFVLAIPAVTFPLACRFHRSHLRLVKR